MSFEAGGVVEGIWEGAGSVYARTGVSKGLDPTVVGLGIG